MNKDGFIAALFKNWSDHEWTSIDGADFQAMAVEHSLLIPRLATEEDCATEYYQRWDYEPGDTINEFAPDLKSIMQAQ